MVRDSLDQEFKIRLNSGGQRPRKDKLELYVEKSIYRAFKAKINPKGKGFCKTAKTYMQNSMVKVSYSGNKHPGQWASHARYLQREGAQIEGRKGMGFDQAKEEIDMTQRLDTWQKEGDERFFRIIVSPEQGERMNLREHARELMKKVESDWNMKIEWVAIEHTNTDNPHVHIAVRGRGIEGRELRIDREYIKSGMRLRSQEVATQKLGVRLRSDVLARRQKAIRQNRFTELDREILRLSENGTHLLCFAGILLNNKNEIESRLQLIGRLQYLQTLGFVDREGLISWKISKDLEQGLKTFQNSQDIVKRKAQHLAVITEPDLPVVYNQLKEGDEILGRVVGFGVHKEEADSRYMLIEGVDGKIHYTHPKMKMLKERAELKIRNGDVISLKVKSFYDNSQKKTFLAFENLGGVNSFKNHSGLTKADEYVLNKYSQDKTIFDVQYPPKSFRFKFYSNMKERVEHFRKLKVLDFEGNVNKRVLKEKMKQ